MRDQNNQPTQIARTTPFRSCGELQKETSSCGIRNGDYPSISVIVPAYNVEAYIEEALDSLLAQTMAFREIIVINDGSTDGTREKLNRYAGHPLVRIHHTVNQGLGPARNAGIALATGDFLYFFDSDDILEPVFVVTVTQALLEDRSVDLMLFSGQSFYDEGYAAEFDEALERRLDLCFASGLEAADALYRAGGCYANAYGYVSRRTLWGDKLRFAPIVYEDAEIFPRLCAAAGCTRVINVSLYRRRLRPNSLVTMRPTQRHVTGHRASVMAAMQVAATLMSNHERFIVDWTIEMAWRYVKSCSDARIPPNLRFLLQVVRRTRYLPHRFLQDAWQPVNRVALLRILKWNTIHGLKQLGGRGGRD